MVVVFSKKKKKLLVNSFSLSKGADNMRLLLFLLPFIQKLFAFVFDFFFFNSMNEINKKIIIIKNRN